jgi:hypothetical protein
MCFEKQAECIGSLEMGTTPERLKPEGKPGTPLVNDLPEVSDPARFFI